MEIGVYMLRAIYARHMKDFRWRERQIDRLAGTDELRAAVEQGAIDAMLKKWNAAARVFEARAKPFHLYR